MPHNKNTDRVVKRILPWLIIIGFIDLIIYMFVPDITTSNDAKVNSTPQDINFYLPNSNVNLKNDPFFDEIDLIDKNLHHGIPFAKKTNKVLRQYRRQLQQNTDKAVTIPLIAHTNLGTSKQHINKENTTLDTTSELPANKANTTADKNDHNDIDNSNEEDTKSSTSNETNGFVKHLAVFERQKNYWQFIKNNEENQTLIKQLEPLHKLLSRRALTRVEILYTDYVKDGVSKPENSKIIAVRGKEKHKTWIYFTHFDKDKIYYYDYDGNAPEPSMDRAPIHYTRITSPFNPKRRHPITGRIRPHEGVDLKAPYGTPVHSTGDGIVSFAGWQHGYGRVVIVKHPNGYETRYAHMSAIKVAVGDSIKRGTVVGKVGNSGISTGHHLHYEVRIDGIAYDPMTVSLPSFKPINRDDMDIWHFRAEQYQVAIKELTRSGYTVN